MRRSFPFFFVILASSFTAFSRSAFDGIWWRTAIETVTFLEFVLSGILRMSPSMNLGVLNVFAAILISFLELSIPVYVTRFVFEMNLKNLPFPHPISAIESPCFM